jgi:endonuclease/exonuclease/phosphatase family metal-dependent hydrolase
VRSPIALLSAALLLVAGCDALFFDREREQRELEDASTRDSGTGDAGGSEPEVEPLPPPPPSVPDALMVTNWNLEFFGDPSNGPWNEPLQQTNVATVMHGSPTDLWALQEISSPAAFRELASGMTGFGSVLSSDSWVEGSASYGNDFTQRVGVIYRTSRLTLLGAKVILDGWYSDFAGRPPLELLFRVNDTGSELVVIVLHLKAQYPSSCTDCWQRRKSSADALKAYLDEAWPNEEVLVLGDWNDDVDTSIVSGADTPFRAIVSDTASYRYVTDVISARGEGTTVSYSSAIDHQLVSDELLTRWRPGATVVLHPAITDYGRNTSDHYPVQSQFSLTR